MPDKNDSASVYRYLGEINNALCEVESDVKDLLPKKEEALLQDFPAIRKAIAPLNLTTPWGQFKQHLGEQTMRSMQNCALDLPEDADVATAEIKQVQDAVNALFHEVRESGIKNPLKNWLLDRLAAIKQMIDLYWIKGPRVVREAFTAMAGEVACYGQRFHEVKKDAPTIFDKLMGLLNKLATIAQAVEKLEPLVQYAGPATELVGRLIQGPS